jgi:DNA-binding MarR family transcriptional regulator
MSHAGHAAAQATRVWQGLRQLVLERHDRRRAVCAALGMSFIRAKALRLLSGRAMTMGDLAASLPADAPYTTLVVGDLERRGLVSRAVHHADRRSKIVTITPAGLESAALAERILGEPPAALLALDPDELAALDRILAKLLAATAGTAQEPPSDLDPSLERSSHQA